MAQIDYASPKGSERFHIVGAISLLAGGVSLFAWRYLFEVGAIYLPAGVAAAAVGFGSYAVVRRTRDWKLGLIGLSLGIITLLLLSVMLLVLFVAFHAR